MDKSLLDLLEKEKTTLTEIEYYQETIDDINCGDLPNSELGKYETKLETAKENLLNCRKEIAKYFQCILSI